MDLLVILFLIILNGFFAMAEIAVISSRKSRLKRIATEGNTGAQIAYNLAEKPSNFLSAIQIGITFIGILTGAIAISDGIIVNSISSLLKLIPVINTFHSQIAFALVIIAITYLSLIVGELVPKRIALSNPERIASLTAPLMLFISNVTNPLVQLLSKSTEFVFRLTKLKPIVSPPITEEEIRILIREGTDMGIFNKTEKKLVERALHLDDLMVRNLMTPRGKIQFFDINKFSTNPSKYLSDCKHSRILFVQGELDKIRGVIHIKDLFQHYLAHDKIEIKNILTKPLLIPENTRALKVLEMFRHSPIHIAMVLDEFGNVQGLVTLNDILEALVGEIKTQNTHDDNQIVKRPDGSILVDGMLSVEELNKLLQVECLPKQEQGAFQTLGGFVISYFDRIPKAGDKFIWNNFQFEVVDMDGNRVDKVLLTTTGNLKKVDHPLIS